MKRRSFLKLLGATPLAPLAVKATESQPKADDCIAPVNDISLEEFRNKFPPDAPHRVKPGGIYSDSHRTYQLVQLINGCDAKAGDIAYWWPYGKPNRVSTMLTMKGEPPIMQTAGIFAHDVKSACGGTWCHIIVRGGVASASSTAAPR